jgi:hypothetical protein
MVENLRAEFGLESAAFLRAEIGFDIACLCSREEL